MGLLLLVLGLVLLLGSHTFIRLRDQRAALVARLGERGYRVLFALVSTAGLALIVYGFALYRATGWIEVWQPPRWTRHVTDLLMWPAVVMVLAAYLPGHIKLTLKHPMLAGVKLWAFAHLIANGDLGSIILFGAFLAWAVYDRIALKRQGPAAAPPAVASWRNDVAAVVVGTLIYLALGLVFHPLVIGVPAFG